MTRRVPVLIIAGAWLALAWLWAGLAFGQSERVCLLVDGSPVTCTTPRRWGYALSAEVEGAHVEARPWQGRPYVCTYPSWPRARGTRCGHPLEVEGRVLKVGAEP